MVNDGCTSRHTKHCHLLFQWANANDTLLSKTKKGSAAIGEPVLVPGKTLRIPCRTFCGKGGFYVEPQIILLGSKIASVGTAAEPFWNPFFLSEVKPELLEHIVQIEVLTCIFVFMSCCLFLPSRVTTTCTGDPGSVGSTRCARLPL